MKPFDNYLEGRGERLFDMKIKRQNTREDDAPKFMHKTGATKCAYCGLDFTDDFSHWLDVTLDHVIPETRWDHLNIKKLRGNDYANVVLCCGACNGFDNKSPLPRKNIKPPTTDEEFIRLRNEFFEFRKPRILKRREKARAFFKTRPWK